MRSCVCAVRVVVRVARKSSRKLEPLSQFKATSSREMPVKAQLQDSVIARCLDVELHSLVPFPIDGFVFAMPGSGAHESHCAPSCLRGKKTYPRKKRIDRYGLRLEQVQRVVATCVKLECVKTVKNKNVANISRHLGSERRDFFASPLPFTGSFSCPHSRGISERGQAL